MNLNTDREIERTWSFMVYSLIHSGQMVCVLFGGLPNQPCLVVCFPLLSAQYSCGLSDKGGFISFAHEAFFLGRGTLFFYFFFQLGSLLRDYEDLFASDELCVQTCIKVLFVYILTFRIVFV